MKKKEITRKLDEIVEFAGVERYLDTPVKRYSSGMYVRLAFAVAAHLECEILIVDEVLAVGDAEFQQKCLGKMGGVMKDEGRTILFVSHDMNAVSKLCSKALLMDKGEVKKSGEVDGVIADYLNKHNEGKLTYEFIGESAKQMYFKSIRMVNSKGEQCKTFYVDEPIFVSFELGINDPSFRCDLFLTMLDYKKRRIFSCESPVTHPKMQLRIEPYQLVRGNYSIETFLNIPHVTKVEMVEDICDFSVIDHVSPMMKHGTYDYGMVLGKYHWNAIEQ